MSDFIAHSRDKHCGRLHKTDYERRNEGVSSLRVIVDISQLESQHVFYAESESRLYIYQWEGKIVAGGLLFVMQ